MEYLLLLVLQIGMTKTVVPIPTTYQTEDACYADFEANERDIINKSLDSDYLYKAEGLCIKFTAK